LRGVAKANMLRGVVLSMLRGVSSTLLLRPLSMAALWYSERTRSSRSSRACSRRSSSQPIVDTWS
jgi:hypothetical protein